MKTERRIWSTHSRGLARRATLTVNFSVGGTAAFGTDYSQSGAATFTATTGTVTFGAGNSTTTVTADPTADSTVEPDETVVLTLTAGTGYNVIAPNTATGTITNDDTDVSVAVSPTSVLEDGAANLVYTFTRAGVTSSPLTVNFSVGGQRRSHRLHADGRGDIQPDHWHGEFRSGQFDGDGDRRSVSRHHGGAG